MGKKNKQKPSVQPPAPAPVPQTQPPSIVTVGEQLPPYYVTKLTDGGPGSVKDACLQSGRTLVFQCEGSIHHTTPVEIKGSGLVFTASPGVTFRGAGFRVAGPNVHDIVLANLRMRDLIGDGITIRDSAYNIDVHHCSIAGFKDGAIDVTRMAHRVTISWCILAEGDPLHNLASLVTFKAHHITYHHNLFYGTSDRNPKSGWDIDGSSAPGLVCDIYNNAIWDYLAYGSFVEDNSAANVRGNFYKPKGQFDPAKALKVNGAGTRVFALDNHPPAVDNMTRNCSAPFPSDRPVSVITDPHTALVGVKNGAGVRPLDALDSKYILSLTP